MKTLKDLKSKLGHISTKECESLSVVELDNIISGLLDLFPVMGTTEDSEGNLILEATEDGSRIGRYSSDPRVLAVIKKSGFLWIDCKHARYNDKVGQAILDTYREYSNK